MLRLVRLRLRPPPHSPIQTEISRFFMKSPQLARHCFTKKLEGDGGVKRLRRLAVLAAFYGTVALASWGITRLETRHTKLAPDEFITGFA
jgi:hypothetical protein